MPEISLSKCPSGRFCDDVSPECQHTLYFYRNVSSVGFGAYVCILSNVGFPLPGPDVSRSQRSGHKETD